MPLPHTARKRFGQNFLHDPAIIQRIINVIHLTAGDHVVEIGPGQGALTQKILSLVEQLEVIELDRDLIPILEENCRGLGKLIIYQADALTFDLTTLTQQPKSLRLIGNLPYNISSPLLFHFLAFAQLIKDMYFMLQKEVVDRIVAGPNSKTYGRLSVMIQYYCAVDALLTVKPGAFKPAPKVDSAVVRLLPYQELPFKARDEQLFAEIVKAAFAQRRKMLRNTLQGFIKADALSALGIDPMARAEQLSVQEFVKICNDIAKM